MKFTHLHVHSHYSLLDGLAKIDPLIQKAVDLNMEALAITDHGAMYGAVEFYQKAKKAGIKPIIGSEVYVAPNGMHQKRPKIDSRRYHLVLLVKNEKGYQNLVKLTTKAWLDGFYYKPRVDKKLLRQHSEGLIACSACLAGEIPRKIQANKPQEAERRVLEYQDIFGKGNFYLELEHHPEIPEQKLVNQSLVKIGKKYKIPLVATHDVHYINPEDAEAQDILMAVNTDKMVADEGRLSMKSSNFSLQPQEQMIKWFSTTPEAIDNTQKIVSQCKFEMELYKTQMPHFATPDNDADAFLKKLAEQGLAKRYGTNTEAIQEQKIRDRLNYELKVIGQTGFASYFLIVQDFVNWAKANNIVVGPGRGSAAGSLVSYLLNVTDIDPLKYNLMFERFLNVDRVEMPDIDLDFADTRRDEVIEYVRRKYGQDHVAQIITFGTMAARGSIRDVGRATNLPYNLCDQIAKAVPFGLKLNEAMKESQELKDAYRTDSRVKKLIDTAKKLEGVARHASTHACGVVITKDPLDAVIPLQHATQGDTAIVTQYGMNSVTALGILKMDFLGLKNLTIIEDTINRVKIAHNEEIQLVHLPLADQKTIELFQKGQTTGIFQLECLSGETIVSNTTIKHLYDRKHKQILESIYLDKGEIHKNKILNVVCSGQKKVFTLIAENNWQIKATKNHYFLTENGWQKLRDIKPGDKILLKKKAKHLLYNICQTCGRQISGQKEAESRFCYHCSAVFYHNPSKKLSREKIKQARIKFYQNGGKPWNHGITKENNQILRQTGRKISRALVGITFEEKYGHKKARELKLKISQRSKGCNNPMFGKRAPHRKGGFRPDLGHYVRSSWEADFARILKLKNINYQYEPQTFKIQRSNGNILHYTPDFYVPSQNTFYEIKGWFHDLDKEKIQLFQEQYPQYSFDLINTTKFAEFALQYKNLINWECPQIPEKSFHFLKVKQIKYAGQELTYDITMEAPGNNFVANGFLVHNSSGMKKYLKQLIPSKFEDIIAMVALYRPGPMELIPDFIARKHGYKRIEYLHPKLEPILAATYGIAVYQEQVLEIVRDLANFTLAEADVLRKAVGKKIKELLNEQHEKFIKGCAKNSIDGETAEAVWRFIEPFARYGFNKAHSTCYAMIGYWTAYLKSHYPNEFMAALLTSEQNDIERIAFLIGECRDISIEILAPDVNESQADFTVVAGNKIRFGLNAIKNVGQNIVQAIVQERQQSGHFSAIENFIERVKSRDLNKKSLESLAKCGALDSLTMREEILENIEPLLNYAHEIQHAHQVGQASLFGTMTNVAPPQLRLAKAEPLPKRQKLLWEKELLGLYVSEHPLMQYAAVLKQRALPCRQLESKINGQRVRVAGLINKINKIMTKNNEPMLFVGLEDLTGRCETVVFPQTLAKTAHFWQLDKPVYVIGKVNYRNGSMSLICDEVEEIK